MPKKSAVSLSEVIISNSATSDEVRRLVKAGKLRKLASRLYTSNLRDVPEQIVLRNIWQLVSAYFPGALISDRSAVELKPASDGSLF